MRARRRLELPAARRPVGELLDPDGRWTFVGCDDMAGRNVERLGASVARVCYARVTSAKGSHLVEVAYTADWTVAFIDWYDF